MFFKFSQIKFKSLAPLILASLGLIWQVHSISKVYFQFNTRVDIVIDAPDRLSMPGLTVCVILSDGLGPRGPFIRESELIYMPINETLEFGKPEVDVVCTVPAPELVRLNPNDSGLFCQNFAPPKISIQYISPGLVARCETFFYRYFNQSPYEVIAADAKDFYRIELSRVTNSTILFFIHSPTDVLHLSEADTITLNIIQTQEIVLATTKFTTNFMPPPFRTNCRYYHDYEYGQWGCVFQCRVKRKQQVCPAWPWNVPASPDIDVPFRVHDEQRCSQKSTGHDCFDSDCHQPQCWNEWYTTTTIYSKERSNNHQLSKLYIRRPFGVEFVYNYVPRLAQIEFICYVASCFGIWLGVSCADALRYVAHLATESRFVNRSKLVQSQASVASSKIENGWTESKIATINGKNALMATKMKSFGRFEQMRPRKIVSYNSSFY